jgi:DNA-binding response OmpR family regulator
VATPTILLADDDRDMHLIGAAIFEHAGFRLLHAYRGDEVISTVLTETPRLVIVDVHLPGRDGVAVARTLAADSRTAAIPVLILTADTQARTEHPEVAEQVAAWLIKPCSPRDLLAKVREIVGEA